MFHWSYETHTNLRARLWKLKVEFLGLTLHEYLDRLFDETPDRDRDQDSNEYGADGISYHPVKRPHKNWKKTLTSYILLN